MKDGFGFAYPKRLRSREECDAIARAIVQAFPRFRTEVSSRRFYLDPESTYEDGASVCIYDPSARCHGSYWSYPVGSSLKDAYERDTDRLAAIFIRALCALGKGYTVGALVANHGLDLDRIADHMVKAGGA